MLRDAGPDGWGQMLIRGLHGLPDGAASLRYLLHSGNDDRWGALAIGQLTSPDVQALVAPKLSKLPELADELRDDDHPRNHAVIYRHDERRWRLAPAFDVVPSADDTPARLFMQVNTGRYDITRESLLADHRRFGLLMRGQAGSRLVLQGARR